MGGLKVGALYSFIKEIRTFFMTTKNRTKISPINFLYIGIVGLLLEFENVKILNTASIWPQIWKGRPKLCQKKISFGDYMIDDVTGWPPIWPSMFLLVQAICAQKPLNRANLSTSMKLFTMLGHHMGTNFRYGAMQVMQYFLPWLPYLFRHYRISDFWPYLYN